jgi:hypothetical protein
VINFIPPLPGKSPQYPLSRRLGELQSWSKLLWRKENLLPLPGIKPQFMFKFPSTVSLVAVLNSWVIVYLLRMDFKFPVLYLAAIF